MNRRSWALWVGLGLLLRTGLAYSQEACPVEGTPPPGYFLVHFRVVGLDGERALPLQPGKDYRTSFVLPDDTHVQVETPMRDFDTGGAIRCGRIQLRSDYGGEVLLILNARLFGAKNELRTRANSHLRQDSAASPWLIKLHRIPGIHIDPRTGELMEWARVPAAERDRHLLLVMRETLERFPDQVDRTIQELGVSERFVVERLQAAGNDPGSVLQMWLGQEAQRNLLRDQNLMRQQLDELLRRQPRLRPAAERLLRDPELPAPADPEAQRSFVNRAPGLRPADRQLVRDALIRQANSTTSQ